MNSSDPLLVLVDGNNLLIRSMFGNKIWNKETGEYDFLKTADGTITSGVYGCLKTLVSYVKTLNPTHMAWMFDWGGSDARTEINKDYKGNRDYDSKERVDLAPQFQGVGRMFDALGVRHHREKGVEADDLIAKYTLEYSPRVPVLIISGDHDFQQLVGPRVRLLNPAKGKRRVETLWTEKRVQQEYGFPPDRLTELFALTGDSSDNVKGVPRVGIKTAQKILTQFPTLQEAVNSHPLLEGHAERVWENLRLITLDGQYGTLAHTLEELEFSKSFDPEPVLKIFNEFEFKSMRGRVLENKLWS